MATALPSLTPFAGLVRLVQAGRDFGEELRLALAEDDPPLRQRRVEMAQANAWGVRYGEIRRLVEEALSSGSRG